MIIKQLQNIGNSKGVSIPNAVLELLDIDDKTDLIIKTDGKNIIIIPIHNNDVEISCNIHIKPELIEKHKNANLILVEKPP